MDQTIGVSLTLSNRQQVWRWRVFASTWLCYAGFYFCRKPFYITKSSLADQLHLSAGTLGTIGAVYLIAYTIGQFVAGAVGNRVGPRLLLLVGMGISVLTGIMFGFANSAAMFIAFMALNGLAQATGWSGTVGNMANWFHREERGTVMGFWATNFQVGGVLANGLAAYALGAFGFRYSFFLGSAVLMAVWVFFYFNQQNRPEDVGLAPIESPADAASDLEQSSSTASTLTRSVVTNVVLIGVFYFFVKFIRYSLWSWAPFFLARNFHQEAGNAGYLSTLFDLFGIAGVIAAGFLSDKVFGSRRAGISLIMIVIMTAACVFLVALGHTSVTLFAVCLSLIGFTLYGPDALLSGAGAMDAGSKRGATLAAGIINGMGSLGSVVQELVIGKMYDRNGGQIGGILIMLLGSSALAALVLLVVNVRNRLGRSNV